jgi:hypothetical protein
MGFRSTLKVETILPMGIVSMPIGIESVQTGIGQVPMGIVSAIEVFHLPATGNRCYLRPLASEQGSRDTS